MNPFPSDTFSDTVIACCTPQGPGALALIRISGPEAVRVGQQISRFSNGRLLSQFPSHTVQYGSIIDADGTTIDTVLYIIMHGTRTFTGYDTVEITCHNNPFIIDAIIARALACGARLAQPGEFTRQAVANDKMDLVQAESLHEFIIATTHQALKLSLSQTKGTLSAILATIEQQLIKALALSESSFEFIDEDMQFGDQINSIMQQILKIIADLKRSYPMQKQLREGIRIALIGSVNAGKSSLFNALLHTHRAIVSPQAGTTRDVIEATCYRNGTHFTLIDTAGLRMTEDSIEQEGIERSYQEAAKADQVLLVADGSQHVSDSTNQIFQDLLHLYRDKIIFVLTKSDLPQIQKPLDISVPYIAVSTITNHNIGALEQLLFDNTIQQLATGNTPFLLNQRQQRLISGLEADIAHIQNLLVEPIAYEIVSYHLNQALSLLTELTGKSISEAAMDAIFKEFCIGK